MRYFIYFIFSLIFLFILLHIFILVNVHAATKLNYCKVVGKYAYVCMDIRQNGGVITDLLDSLENGNTKTNDKHPEFDKERKSKEATENKELFKRIAFKAFAYPKMYSEEGKENACVEFSNQIFLYCMENE